MARGKPVTDVYRAWDAIILPSGQWTPNPDGEASRALYARCFDGERWLVGLKDAHLVAMMGASQAFLGERYAETIQIAKSLFLHSEIEDLDESDRNALLECMGAAHIAFGQIEEGVETLRIILASNRRGHRTHYRRLVATALGPTPGSDPETPIPGEVGRLAYDLLFGWPGNRRRAARIAELRTWGELDRLLNEAQGF